MGGTLRALLNKKYLLKKIGIQVAVFVMSILFFGGNFRENPPRDRGKLFKIILGRFIFHHHDNNRGFVVRFRLVHSTCKTSGLWRVASHELEHSAEVDTKK